MNGQRRIGSQSDLSSNSSDTLNFCDGVNHGVPCNVKIRLNILFFAAAEIGTANEFTDDDQVCAADNVRAKRRVGEKALGSKVGGTDVGVEAESFSESKETCFRANRCRDTPFWASNGTYLLDSYRAMESLEKVAHP